MAMKATTVGFSSGCHCLVLHEFSSHYGVEFGSHNAILGWWCLILIGFFQEFVPINGDLTKIKKAHYNTTN